MQSLIYWTDADGYEQTVFTQLRLQEWTPGHHQGRFSHLTADGSARNTITIGDGQNEATAQIRHQRHRKDIDLMIKAGLSGTTLTIVPDFTNVPHEEFDVELLDAGPLTVEPGSKQQSFAVRNLRWRRLDGGRFDAFLGEVDGQSVVHRFAGGGSLDDWTFTRAAQANTAARRKRDGTLEFLGATANLARTHWLDLDGDGVFEEPSLLLELGRANVASNPNTLSSWSPGGTPNVTGGQSDPAGGTDGWLLEDDDGTATENLSTVLSFTGDATKAASVRLKAGTAAETVVSLFDSTAGTHRHRIIVTWTDGVPSLSTSIGSGTLYPIETLADGWYEIGFSADGVLAGNTNRLYLYPAGLTASATGTVYAYIGQAEDGEFPTSALNTTTARNVEVASHVMPAAVLKPSTAWTGYFRWVAGMDGDGDAANPIISSVGDGGFSSSVAHLRILWTSTPTLRLRHENGPSADNADISGTGVSRGDTCEAIVTWNGDGTATIYLWVNGTFIDSDTLTGITPADAWEPDGNGDVRVYYNSRDGGGNAGAMSLRDSVLVEGTVSGTAAQIRSAFTRYVDQS